MFVYFCVFYFMFHFWKQCSPVSSRWTPLAKEKICFCQKVFPRHFFPSFLPSVHWTSVLVLSNYNNGKWKSIELLFVSVSLANKRKRAKKVKSWKQKLEVCCIYFVVLISLSFILLNGRCLCITHAWRIQHTYHLLHIQHLYTYKSKSNIV